MFFLFLGLLDFAFGIIMILMHFHVFHSWRLALAGAIFWIGKGVLLRGSFLSVIDVLAGLYMLGVASGLHTPLAYLFMAMMTYKLILSLVLRG